MGIKGKEKQDMNFKRPKDILNLINTWQNMDIIVHTTKKGEAVKFWDKNCAPHQKEGNVYSVCYGSFYKNDDYTKGTIFRPITRKDVIDNNPFNFENAFKCDSFKRIYELFSKVMAM